MTDVTLKLRGHRQIEAADWMMGKPTPEEVDEDGREWEQLGVDVRDGVLSIPAHCLADFVEELENGVEIMLNIADDFPSDWDDYKDARATARALTTIAEKLRPLVNRA